MVRTVELDVVCVAMEFKTWRQMILTRGKMYKMKSSGPSTKPWGTPCDRGAAEEVLLLIVMNCCRSLRYDLNQETAVARVSREKEVNGVGSQGVWHRWSVQCRW